MSVLSFVGGVEALLLVLLVAKIRENRQLLQEIRRCQFDFALALTLAGQGKFGEAHAAARKWADRMRALKRGETYRPDPPPRHDSRTKLH